jgi:plastocyanin
MGAACGGKGAGSNLPSSSSPSPSSTAVSSATPSATASATASSTPSPVDVPKGCPKPGATCLSAPADEPFAVTLHNDVHNEGLAPQNHNFSVYAYHVPSLAAGVYVFKCAIHPETMTGVLVVKQQLGTGDGYRTSSTGHGA